MWYNTFTSLGSQLGESSSRTIGGVVRAVRQSIGECHQGSESVEERIESREGRRRISDLGNVGDDLGDGDRLAGRSVVHDLGDLGDTAELCANPAVEDSLLVVDAIGRDG